jgi:hypothetical protein
MTRVISPKSHCRVLLTVLVALAAHNGGIRASDSTGEGDIDAAAPNSLGRCLREPVVAGDGAVVLYDVVVNMQSLRVFFVGPHKVLWIVPTTPALQEKTVNFANHFGEGRDLHWLPRRFEAASTCKFALHAKQRGSSQPPADGDATTFVSLHGDPYEHVNLASCPLPSWAAEALRAGNSVSVELVLAPKPLFQALPCTESNGTNTGACEACRQLAEQMHRSHMQAIAAECSDGAQMARRIIRLPPLRVCLPPARAHVELSLCCIVKNEARYMAEWIEYSKLVGVSRFYIYDHNSTDKTREVLAPYEASGSVVVHDWSFEGYPQKEVHTHCTHRYAHETSWLGLLDVDEFLVPVKSDSVLAILEETSAFGPEHVVLRLSAAMFGTSGA